MATPGLQSENVEIHCYERYGSWSEHVMSWTHRPTPGLHVVRYEDMLNAPHKTFAGVTAFLGLKVPRDRLDKAIKLSSFKVLREQEKRHGFIERTAKSAAVLSRRQGRAVAQGLDGRADRSVDGGPSRPDGPLRLLAVARTRSRRGRKRQTQQMPSETRQSATKQPAPAHTIAAKGGRSLRARRSRGRRGSVPTAAVAPSGPGRRPACPGPGGMAARRARARPGADQKGDRERSAQTAAPQQPRRHAQGPRRSRCCARPPFAPPSISCRTTRTR